MVGTSIIKKWENNHFYDIALSVIWMTQFLFRFTWHRKALFKTKFCSSVFVYLSNHLRLETNQLLYYMYTNLFWLIYDPLSYEYIPTWITCTSYVWSFVKFYNFIIREMFKVTSHAPLQTHPSAVDLLE